MAKTRKSEGVERICAHNIEWWLDTGDGEPVDELDECSIEHIKKMLGDNFVEGELCVLLPDGDTEVYGWWNIRR